MSSSETPEPPASTVEEAMERFRAAWLTDDRPDPEAFLEAHAHLGDALRIQVESFLLVMGVLPSMAVDERQDEINAENEKLKSGRILNDFEIIGEIGRGGMGVVYEAMQLSLQRKVALKILPAHLTLSKDAVKKFHREAEAGGRQKHPAIVMVHAMGEEDGVHYIAHELVEGGRTLADALHESSRSGFTDPAHFRNTALIITRVAEALAHSHAAGVIHRDVKPSNILLTRDGAPKVTDFGLARIEEALALSRSGEVVGTPFYMSPEQAGGHGKGIDNRTDIYSLGVTLYEALTFIRPFQGRSSQEVLRKIVSDEPRHPCKVNPRVPRDLAVICLKAMEKDPNRRYRTMREFAEDLERHLSGRPIRAVPASVPTRVWKRCKRNPALSAAVVAAGCLFLALIGMWIKDYFASKTQLLKERSRILISESEKTINDNPALALLLAKKAVSDHPSEAGNNALIAALRVCQERDFVDLGSELQAAVFSPDNRLVAYGDASGWINIYNMETRSACYRTKIEKTAIHGLAFNGDGNRLAVATSLNEARIIDFENDKVVCRLVGHTGPIRSVCFSHDDKNLISASDDLTACIWDAATGDRIHTLVGHTWHVNSARFSRDGRWIITASEDKTAIVWDSVSGKALTTLNGQKRGIVFADFSHDGRWLVTSSKDESLWLWTFNEDPGEERAKEFLRLHPESTSLHAAFSSSDERLIASGKDGAATIWSLQDIEKLRMFGDLQRSYESNETKHRPLEELISHNPLTRLQRHEAGIVAARFYDENDKVLTVSTNGTVRRWSTIQKLGGIALSLDPQSQSRFAFRSFSPLFAWVAEDQRSCTLREIATGKEMPLQIRSSPDWLETAEFNNMGQQYDVIKTETGVRTRIKGDDSDESTPFHSAEYSIRSIWLSPDGKTLIVQLVQNFLQFWDLEEKCLLSTQRHHGDIKATAFDRACRHLTLSLDNKNIQTYCLDTGEEIHWRDGFESDLESIEYGKDDGSILTVSEEGKAELWDPLFEKRKLIIDQTVNEACFLSCEDHERVLVIADDRKTVKIYDPIGGSVATVWNDPAMEVRSVIPGSGGSFLCIVKHGNGAAQCLQMDWKDYNKAKSLGRYSGKLNSVALSPDGRTVLTIHDDRTIVVTDTSSATILWRFNLEGNIADAGFWDNSQIYTATREGNVQFWPVDPFNYVNSIELRPFSISERQQYLNEARSINSALETMDPSAVEDIDKKPEKKPVSPVSKDPEAAEWRFEDFINELEPGRMEPFYFIAGRNLDEKTYEKAVMRFDPGREEPAVIHDFDQELAAFSCNGNGRKICIHKKNEESLSSFWLMDIEGDQPSVLRPVYDTGRKAVGTPFLHPDGNTVYFHMSDDDTRVSAWSIYVANTLEDPHQNIRRVVGGPDESFVLPRISPDGRSLLFIHDPRMNYDYTKDLWVTSLSRDGMAAFNAVRITEDSPERRFADKQGVVDFEGSTFYSLANEDNRKSLIYKISLDERNRIPFLEFPDTYQIMELTLSPAGRLGVTSIDPDKKTSVWIFDFEESSAFRLEFDKWEPQQPQFFNP